VSKESCVVVVRLCSSFFGGVVVLLRALFFPLAFIGFVTPTHCVWLARVYNLYGVPYEKED
jgi:hypothetical protein